MNKLYKYLPFDIQGEYTWEQCDDDGCRECTCIVDLLGIDTYNEELKVLDCGTIVDINYDQFKPILRPFEHLIKELPLTKAAAEMIGMEEGHIVKPIDKLTGVSRIEYLLTHKVISKISERASDFLRAMHFAVDFKEDEYIKLKD